MSQPSNGTVEHFDDPNTTTTTTNTTAATENVDNGDVEPTGDEQLTLRALVTTKEAGVIIGKGKKKISTRDERENEVMEIGEYGGLEEVYFFKVLFLLYIQLDIFDQLIDIFFFLQNFFFLSW